MSKKMLSALVIIALLVIILVVNRGSTSLDLLVVSVKGLKSLIFLGFTAVGIAIGVLLS